jgi:hypothetical protein
MPGVHCGAGRVVKSRRVGAGCVPDGCFGPLGGGGRGVEESSEGREGFAKGHGSWVQVGRLYLQRNQVREQK